MISLFRFVTSFAVLQSCVRGEHGKFVSGGTQSIDGGLIACVVAVSSVATGPLEVHVQMRQEFSCVDGVMWDQDLIAVGRRGVATFCSCCGLESVRGQVRMPSFWMRRRFPIGSKSTARLTTRVMLVVLLLNFFQLICAFADSIIIRRCRFRVGSSWFVVTVLVMLFGHHRRHKVGMLHMCSIRRCCSSFLVLR